MKQDLKEKPVRRALLPEKIKDHRIARPIFDGLIFLAAVMVVAFRIEVEGTLVFLGIIGLILILSDRLADAFLPLILLSVFVTRCYDSFETFIQYIGYYVVIISCFLFHVIYYCKKPRLGYTFPGLVAVAIAVTLGGLFTIPAEDYFRPFSLYYTLGLGIAMPLLYLIIQPQADEEARKKFLKGLFLSGCLAMFAIVMFYAEAWNDVLEQQRIVSFQSSNNLATFLMISLPIGFLYSRKSRWLILFPFLQYACLLLCGSRGGLLLGTVEFLFLLVFFCFYKSDWFRRAFFIGMLAIGCVLVIALLPKIGIFLQLYPEDTAEKVGFSRMVQEIFRSVTSDESRTKLFFRSLDNFRANPVFGTGLGYTGNLDLYNPKTGAISWYHMWAPQIWGSLGSVGVLAYGFQLFRRVRLAFARREFPMVTLSLCYLGLFLMSQVNPGEFCPIPYGVIATAIFALIESRPKRKRPSAPTTHKRSPRLSSDSL